jgi:hypothetical protein
MPRFLSPRLRFFPQILLFGYIVISSPLPGSAEAGLESCSSPSPGRYVIMQKGTIHHAGEEEPVARLLQELWEPDGTITGTAFERIGKTFQQFEYTGTVRSVGSCHVQLKRSQAPETVNGSLDAEAVLDSLGRPRYSLTTFPGSTITGIWRQQKPGLCAPTTLKGAVLSQQHGLSWQKGWRPNAVVQRESWHGRYVQGVALSSYAGALEKATYTGRMRVNPDCTATVVQRDSEGVDYNYRSIVMADGSGYFYLQQDPNDLTIGWLEAIDVHH